MPAPITLTLYDKNDQPMATYTRGIVPWGILKRAVRLQQELDQTAEVKPAKHPLFRKPQPAASPEEHQLELVGQFVVELFSNQFSIRDLEAGADVGEIMTVFESVLSRAGDTIQANPTMRPKPRK